MEVHHFLLPSWTAVALMTDVLLSSNFIIKLPRILEEHRARRLIPHFPDDLWHGRTIMLIRGSIKRVSPPAARQPRPFHCILAFLDPLLAGTVLIAESDETFRRARQVDAMDQSERGACSCRHDGLTDGGGPNARERSKEAARFSCQRSPRRSRALSGAN